MNPSDLVAQITDELSRLAGGLAPVLGDIDLGIEMERRVTQIAPMLAAQLTQSEDDKLAGQTVIDLMMAMWPRSDPDLDWWRTPLGRVCARSFGRADPEEITHQVAADMLGVERSTVGRYVHDGVLERGPGGGVLRSSVLARIGRQASS